MFIRNKRSKLTTFAYGTFSMFCQKEKWFINFLFIIFQKCMSVGQYRMIESEHEVIYKQQDIRGSIS